MNDEKDLVTKHLQYAQPQPVSARKAAPIAPAETLDELRALVEGCTKCDLCETRTKIVFGSGNPHARILVIGEAPGKNEDLQGEPFVGAAGKFLSELLEDAGLKREDIFIANVLKCRPPANPQSSAARDRGVRSVSACANQDHQPRCNRYARQLRHAIHPAYDGGHHALARHRATGRALSGAAHVPSGGCDL